MPPAFNPISKRTLAAKINKHNLWVSSKFSQGEQLHLIGINLTNANLSKLDFRSASFLKCNMSGIDFTPFNLTEGYFVKCILRDCNFEKVNLRRATFDECIFSRSNFKAAKAKKSFFRDCKLTSCDLSNANFFDADISHSQLTYSNLSYTNFANSAVVHTKVGKTLLNNTNFTSSYLEDSNFPDIQLETGKIYHLNPLRYDLFLYNKQELINFSKDSICMILSQGKDTFDMLFEDSMYTEIPNWVKRSAVGVKAELNNSLTPEQP